MMTSDFSRRRKGFTLLEIMIVCLLIGVIMSVAVPSWVKSRQTSAKRICQENLWKIEAAKEFWALETKQSNGATPTLDLLKADYLRQGPVCPSGGVYNPGPVGEPPTCSIGGEHSIQVQ